MLRTQVAASLLSLLVVSVAAEQTAPAALLLNPETRSAFCDPCMRIVGAIENGVEKEGTNLEKHAEDICDDVLGHIGNLAEMCKEWVDKDFDKILDKIENKWTPDVICKDYHLC